MSIEKVYIVTTGSYSDYSIRAVYLTEEEANEAAGVFAGDVEEHEVGKMPDHPKGMTAWWVQMSKDGNTIHSAATDGTDKMPEYFFIGKNYQRIAPFSCRFNMWARDEKHAVKIANERRVQLIANNEWPE